MHKAFTRARAMPEISDRRTGQCLCGAVKLSARLSKTDIHACHCTQCQRWTGGGPLFVVAVEDLEASGEDNISTYQASDHGERASCSVCGSPLWWRMQTRPVQSVAVGLLDDQSGLKVTEEIFIDFRPCWLEAHDGASQSTQAEEYEKLSAFLSKEQS